jgi:hypothetical protein
VIAALPDGAAEEVVDVDVWAAECAAIARANARERVEMYMLN